jgi:hypothetical protein
MLDFKVVGTFHVPVTKIQFEHRKLGLRTARGAYLPLFPNTFLGDVSDFGSAFEASGFDSIASRNGERQHLNW